MNQSRSQENIKVDEAERAVSASMGTFEKAMDELAGAVDEAGEVVQNLVGFTRLPKEELKMLKERVKYVLEDVKSNPQPYVLAAAAALGLVFLQSWRHRSSAGAPVFSDDAKY